MPSAIRFSKAIIRARTDISTQLMRVWRHNAATPVTQNPIARNVIWGKQDEKSPRPLLAVGSYGL
jgi:hypothetical protein